MDTDNVCLLVGLLFALLLLESVKLGLDSGFTVRLLLASFWP